MGRLNIQDIEIDLIKPNPWNPNRQTDRQFEAEMESIKDNGFISPIIVRKIDENFEIVDGEHRWKAMGLIIEEGDLSNDKLAPMIKDRKIPAVILEIPDSQAKKLTIIMNETRGKPNIADLGSLLNDLERELGEDLITGLPYSQQHLEELISIGDFNWDDVQTNNVSDSDFEREDDGFQEIRAMVDQATFDRWKTFLKNNEDKYPQDPKGKAGGAIIDLLNRAEA